MVLRDSHLLRPPDLRRKATDSSFDSASLERLLANHLDRIDINKQDPAGVSRTGDTRNDQTQAPVLPEDVVSDILAWNSRSDYAKLACVNKKFKALTSSEYLYKLRRRNGVVEHWIYIACILMPWEAFDPVGQRWMQLPAVPCDECFTYADKESLAVGTELLVFGREFPGLAIWKYSVLVRSWSRCCPMGLPRCLFASSSIGGIALVAGGIDRIGSVLKSAEIYDSETGRWESLPDMTTPRKMCSGFFMDGKFYVIGGMASSTTCLTSGEEFDLVTRKWRRIENMYPASSPTGHPGVQSPPLVAVVENELYWADQATNEVKLYNKISNTWVAVKRLPVRADSSNGWGLAFKGCGKKLIVIGGHKACEVIVLHSWDPRGGHGVQWNVIAVKEQAGSFVSNCAVMGC